MLKHLQEPWIYLLLIFSILIVDYVRDAPTQPQDCSAAVRPLPVYPGP